MDRRAFLSGISGAVSVAALTPGDAEAADAAPALRGSIDASKRGLSPTSPHDQGRLLQALLNEAAAGNLPLFLPPGRYVVSNVVLPPGSRLLGIAGASEIAYGGGGHLLAADGPGLVELRGLVLDGANLALADYVPALVHIAGRNETTIEDCTVRNSSKSGIALDRSGGRVSFTQIRDIADTGLRAIESTGLSLLDNTITGCGNGGIRVWRWSEGEDGTIVSGNRIAGIRADAGGTGENGNGINIFRAHGVMVSGNHISDCAFTAVRANSSSNVQITGNHCRGCGEVGIYSEFSFTGAVIANNIVDRAATGISVANFREGGRIAVVSNNIVRDITGRGPYPVDQPGFGVGIAVEADAVVAGNVIDGAPLYGMLLGWGPYLRDVSATGNVIRRAPVGVAVSVVDGAGSAVISDNLIAGASRGAIVGMRWADRASGDLAESGADSYPHLTVERNRTS